MKVLLTSAYDKHLQLAALERLAASDCHGEHQVVQSPDKADVILFVEDAQFDDYFYSKLRQHPWVKQYPEKIFMYNEVDFPWCVLPGLYCSMPSTEFQHGRQVAFPYLTSLNPHVSKIHTWDSPRRWLFSFVGSASHKSRRDILTLKHTCSSAEIHDTSEFDAWKCQNKRLADECSLYAKTMAESHYVLCPRGLGTSSSRLFEALEAGRAPVIISNNWVAPPHIDWRFAVRISEGDIAKIPAKLESIKDEAIERGEAARRAWERAYSDTSLFHTAVNSVQMLRSWDNGRSALSVSSDKLYRTKIRLEHSARSFARALRSLQSDSRLGS